jgi:hypothetical protein
MAVRIYTKLPFLPHGYTLIKSKNRDLLRLLTKQSQHIIMNFNEMKRDFKIISLFACYRESRAKVLESLFTWQVR